MLFFCIDWQSSGLIWEYTKWMTTGKVTSPSVGWWSWWMEQARSQSSIEVMTSLQFGLPICRLIKGRIGLAHPHSNCFTSGRVRKTWYVHGRLMFLFLPRAQLSEVMLFPGSCTFWSLPGSLLLTKKKKTLH